MQKLTQADFRERLYRRRYLVPNVVTVGNLFCGFLTIIYSSSGRYEKATIAIAVAILLDGLDGRVARRLNATSKFGVEFDSFSDLVSFGVAPAILMYNWCFLPMADEFGVTVCFLFAVAAASRLARFNVTEPDLTSFRGLPTPAAAGAVAALVNLLPSAPYPTLNVVSGTLFLGVLAYLMVSPYKFFSPKGMKVRDLRTRFQIMVAAVIALLWYHSGLGFFALAIGYASSGPISQFLADRAARSREVTSQAEAS